MCGQTEFSSLKKDVETDLGVRDVGMFFRDVRVFARISCYLNLIFCFFKEHICIPRLSSEGTDFGGTIADEGRPQGGFALGP